MPARSAEYMDDMRERILAAASQCLAEKGLSTASLTDVCEAAKISRGALYVHFRSKSEMLCALVERSIKRQAVKAAFDDAATLRELLVKEYGFTSSDDRNMLYSEVEFLAAARTDEPLREVIRRSIDARAERFRTGIRGLRKRGELRDDLSEESAAVMLGWFFEGTLNLRFGTAASEAVYIEAVDRLLSGMVKPKVLHALIQAAASA